MIFLRKIILDWRGPKNTKKMREGDFCRIEKEREGKESDRFWKELPAKWSEEKKK